MMVKAVANIQTTKNALNKMKSMRRRIEILSCALAERSIPDCLSLSELNQEEPSRGRIRLIGSCLVDDVADAADGADQILAELFPQMMHINFNRITFQFALPVIDPFFKPTF